VPLQQHSSFFAFVS